MTKKELIKSLSDKVMITERDSNVIFDVLFDIIKENLLNNGKVKIRNFGTFFIEDRKPRKAYSPYDGSEIDVPAKKVIKFRVANSLKNEISEI